MQADTLSRNVQTARLASLKYLQTTILIGAFFFRFALNAQVPSGARIQAGTSGARVRSAAGASSYFATVNAGTYGTVVTGPVPEKISGSSDQTVYNWYQINWDSLTSTGWSADVGFTQPAPGDPLPESPGYEGSPGEVVSSLPAPVV